MNIANQLPEPLSDFVVDVPKNTYYDFQLKPGSAYPLSGVVYPVDYGNIPGYIAEDGHELDLFVGSTANGLQGFVVVDRGEDIPDEHKFYVGLNKAELDKILAQLQPVLLEHQAVENTTTLLVMISVYKKG